MLNLGGHMPCNYVCGHYMTLPWCQPQANAETSEIVDKRWLFGCCNEHWASWPRAILAAGSTKPSHKKKWKSCLELGHLKHHKKKWNLYLYYRHRQEICHVARKDMSDFHEISLSEHWRTWSLRNCLGHLVDLWNNGRGGFLYGF